jgi:hypothetical protein
VDASRTRRELGWQPSGRHAITRRLLVMVERMSSDPPTWQRLNEAVLRRVAVRPGLRISNALAVRRDEVAAGVVAAVHAGAAGLERCRGMPAAELEWSLEMVLRLLAVAVRTHDRSPLLGYLADLADHRFAEGFTAAELGALLALTERTVVEALVGAPELAGLESAVRDRVSLSFALAREEVEDRFDELAARSGPGADFEVPERRPPATRAELERLVANLEAFTPHAVESAAVTGERP